MSDFDTEWLALREAADTQARNVRLLDRLNPVPDGRSPQAVLDVTDLGSGTGANMRWLAPLLGGRQRWLIVDHDTRLLHAERAQTANWASARGFDMAHVADDTGRRIDGRDFELTVEACQLDMAAAPARLPLPDAGLVTASALLDLVSRPWLEQLADAIATRRAAVCFALTYDGRIELAPPHPADTELRALVNAHQRGDKGFGPALGPAATGVMAELLDDRGYRTDRALSDWQLGRADRALQCALADGWVHAAVAIDPSVSDTLDEWLSQRRSQILCGELEIRVGHEDLIAVPG